VVPKGQLFTLVAVNLLFVAYGIVAFAIALLSRPREIRGVETQLSVLGLVANLSEGGRARMHLSKLEDLFQEREYNAEKLRMGTRRRDRNVWAFVSLTEEAIQ
jgi:hypothetical protein